MTRQARRAWRGHIAGLIGSLLLLAVASVSAGVVICAPELLDTRVVAVGALSTVWLLALGMTIKASDKGENEHGNLQ